MLFPLSCAFGLWGHNTICAVLENSVSNEYCNFLFVVQKGILLYNPDNLTTTRVHYQLYSRAHDKTGYHGLLLYYIQLCYITPHVHVYCILHNPDI